jgi:hypothetical protein
VIVEFPAGTANFTGEAIEELLELLDTGTNRVVDVVMFGGCDRDL